LVQAAAAMRDHGKTLPPEPPGEDRPRRLVRYLFHLARQGNKPAILEQLAQLGASSTDLQHEAWVQFLWLAQSILWPGPAEPIRADVEPQIEPPALPAAPEDGLPTVWYHGGRSYSADGRTHSLVSTEQHNALSAFLDCDQSLDTKALEKKGISNVSSVMQKLAKRFGDAVRTPKKKGEGYYIRVRTVRQDIPTE
jgi:hypothetical protein